MNSWEKQITKLELLLGHQFKNRKWIYIALTHSSYANEHRKEDIKYNERLEFLGDSVLGLSISEYLFAKLEDLPEGELTKLRAVIVCESALAQVARKLKVGEFLRLGKGEMLTGGRERASILADAMESIIGAIYMDSDFKTAKEFVLNQFDKIIRDAKMGKRFMDYKTELQEYIQKEGTSVIEYKVINEQGPDHQKIFEIEVYRNNNGIGKGKGHSKKEAEQNAALNALNNLKK